MTKRTEADWRLLLQQQVDSGLSVKAFCKVEGLCRHHFGKRKRALYQGTRVSKSETFIQLETTREAFPRSVIIKSGAVEIHCNEQVSRIWLWGLLRDLS